MDHRSQHHFQSYSPRSSAMDDNESFLELSFPAGLATLSANPQAAKSPLTRLPSTASLSSSSSTPSNSVHDSAQSEAGATEPASTPISDPKLVSAKDIMADLDNFMANMSSRPRRAPLPSIESLNITRRPQYQPTAPPAPPPPPQRPAAPAPLPPTPKPTGILRFLRKDNSVAAVRMPSPARQPSPIARQRVVGGVTPLVHSNSTTRRATYDLPLPARPQLPPAHAFQAQKARAQQPSATQAAASQPTERPAPPAVPSFRPTTTQVAPAQAFNPRGSKPVPARFAKPSPIQFSAAAPKAAQAAAPPPAVIEPTAVYTTPYTSGYVPGAFYSKVAPAPPPSAPKSVDDRAAMPDLNVDQMSPFASSDFQVQRRARTTRRVRVKRVVVQRVDEAPEAEEAEKFEEQQSPEPPAAPLPPPKPAGPPVSILALFEQHKAKYGNLARSILEKQLEGQGVGQKPESQQMQAAADSAVPFGASLSVESVDAVIVHSKAKGKRPAEAVPEQEGKPSLPSHWRTARPAAAAVLPDGTRGEITGKGDSPRDFEQGVYVKGGAKVAAASDVPLAAAVLDNGDSYGSVSGSSHSSGSQHIPESLRGPGEPRAPRSLRRPSAAQGRGLHLHTGVPFSTDDGSTRSGDPLSNFSNSWRKYRDMQNHFYTVEPGKRNLLEPARPVFYAVAGPTAAPEAARAQEPPRGRGNSRPPRGRSMPVVDSAMSLVELRQRSGPGSDEMSGKGYQLGPVGSSPPPMVDSASAAQ